ncbi:hypothetical protein Pcinc_035542 [Petrolisthes cinctipes]|uniref:Uncharacterized protein n=1 Tax=Petrolisthes cinctipes TaxID=88211 RepID=A0AAE1BWJ0_PETCI|nr:hypothetical protein Pcinc_035542 [Petrolisthes cinctipes]
MRPGMRMGADKSETGRTGSEDGASGKNETGSTGSEDGASDKNETGRTGSEDGASGQGVKGSECLEAEFGKGWCGAVGNDMERRKETTKK